MSQPSFTSMQQQPVVRTPIGRPHGIPSVVVSASGGKIVRSHSRSSLLEPSADTSDSLFGAPAIDSESKSTASSKSRKPTSLSTLSSSRSGHFDDVPMAFPKKSVGEQKVQQPKIQPEDNVEHRIATDLVAATTAGGVGAVSGSMIGFYAAAIPFLIAAVFAIRAAVILIQKSMLARASQEKQEKAETHNDSTASDSLTHSAPTIKSVN